MKKRMLLLSVVAALSLGNVNFVQAADVTSWAEINTNRADAEINFLNDITAEPLSTYPSPISFTSATDQVINGDYHSFSSNDLHTDRWYYYSLSVAKTGGTLNVTNLGKSSNGDASDNTFSYTDIDGNSVYKISMLQ